MLFVVSGNIIFEVLELGIFDNILFNRISIRREGFLFLELLLVDLMRWQFLN
ncbi:Uncharacterised protein [Mycobacteroides abscessus subsp. abscessus]|nr:Uncharacterised protein [Mycobacteroides abscessus subsp. abscessus]